MYLKRIFANIESEEGLYAMFYDGEEFDEYERIFDLWADAQYVLDYLKNNEAYIRTPYFEGAEIEDLAQKVDLEAEELENLLYDYFYDEDKTLQMLFIPIGNQFSLPRHQKTKAFVNDRKYFPNPILRIYAIRISENSFVLTGGAIKLVKKMDDHSDTQKELEKLEIAKEFLQKMGFNTIEDFKIII